MLNIFIFSTNMYMQKMVNINLRKMINSFKCVFKITFLQNTQLFKMKKKY